MSSYRSLLCIARCNAGLVERSVASTNISLSNKLILNAAPNSSVLFNVPALQVISRCSLSSHSDSDKGTEDKKRGQSTFWRQKMRKHHSVIDVDGDGLVSWADFELFIKKFSALGQLQKEEIENFTSSMRKIWEELWTLSGNPDAYISYDQFLFNMQEVVNTKERRDRIGKPFTYLFNAVDWNRSGDISIKEFITLFKCMNLSEEAARKAFAVIDTNGDGSLSLTEYVSLGRDFFLTEDENRPSKLFWGPLTA